MNKKFPITSYIWFLISIISVLLLTCCAMMTRPTAGPPMFHVWGLLVEEGSEKTGYGMYTYVLLGRRVDDQTSLDTETVKRYQSLLNAIIQSTSLDIEIKVEKAESNIFYIPAIKPCMKIPFPLENYNSSLALNYITRLANMVKDDHKLVERFTIRPGPFLISTIHPLGEITEREFLLLYADLSDSNPAAMKDTISAYKKRISKGKVNSIERFAPLRLALLNWILDIDDNLKIIKAEAAQWMDG